MSRFAYRILCKTGLWAVVFIISHFNGWIFEKIPNFRLTNFSHVVQYYRSMERSVLSHPPLPFSICNVGTMEKGLFCLFLGSSALCFLYGCLSVSPFVAAQYCYFIGLQKRFLLSTFIYRYPIQLFSIKFTEKELYAHIYALQKQTGRTQNMRPARFLMQVFVFRYAVRRRSSFPPPSGTYRRWN